MKKPTWCFLLCSLASLLPYASAGGQAVPAAVGATPPTVGFELPRIGGSFNYSLNASELISTGFYNSGADYTTNFSGNLAYLSSSEKHPFDAVYTGGILVANSGQPTTIYQELSVSQAYKTKHWNFLVQDAVSYLPESPVTGFSGIPGVGDLGVDPVTVGPQSGIGILTQYGTRVSNTVTGSASRTISAHLTAQASGYASIQSFTGNNADQALNNHNEGASAGVGYRFDGRNNLTVTYNYTNFAYSNSPYAFSTQGGTVDYARQWSRRFTTDVYAGPQYITSSYIGTIPSSTQLAAGAGASYRARVLFYTLNYSRGVNNGSGVIPGSFSDNVVGAVHRQFGRTWNVSGSLGYSRSTSLAALETYTFVSESVAAGGQASRRIARRAAVYASYTLEHQSLSGTALPLDAFHGFYQIVGVGISYSPGSTFFGR